MINLLVQHLNFKVVGKYEKMMEKTKKHRSSSGPQSHKTAT